MNFKYFVYLFFFTFIFYQCGERKERILIESLQGDWLSNDSNYFYLTFKDRLYNKSSSDGNIFHKFKKYSVVNDTLILEDYYYNKDRKFEIAQVPVKVLRLKSIDRKSSSSELFILRNLKGKYIDTFTLEKLEVMFEYPGQRMLLSIDTTNMGFIKYWIYDKRSANLFGWPADSGSYKMSLTKRDFNLIQDKVRIIPLGDIGKKYPRTSSYLYPIIKSIIYIKLKNNETSHRIETSVNGVIGYTTELSILYSYLFHINTFFKLEKDKEDHKFEITYSQLQPYFLTY